MGRKTLENQAIHILSKKMAIGQSRHLAKKELRSELGDEYRFDSAVSTIHSYGTRTAYQQTALQFARWCVDSCGIGKYTRLETCKTLVQDYLQFRIDAGMSVPTLKKDRSALGKLFGEQISFPLPERKPEDIVRSRGPKEMDKHFSEKNNADLVTITRATGGRREDIGKFHTHNFCEIEGRLFVKIMRSKGGRNRLAPVLPNMEKAVRDYLAECEAEGEEKLFERIHSKADIHAYRREYAQELYKTISRDRTLRDKILQNYPPRKEPGVKSSTYTTRRNTNNNMTFDRDDLYLVSQALGHNRLDVTVTHYLL